MSPMFSAEFPVWEGPEKSLWSEGWRGGSPEVPDSLPHRLPCTQQHRGSQHDRVFWTNRPVGASSTDTTGLGKTEKRDRLGNQGVSQSLVVSREDLSSGQVDATAGKNDLLVDTACLPSPASYLKQMRSWESFTPAHVAWAETLWECWNSDMAWRVCFLLSCLCLRMFMKVRGHTLCEHSKHSL